MVNRLSRLSKTNSFFVFGARGVGKTSLIKELFFGKNEVLFIDLLNPKVEEKYATDPEILVHEARSKKFDWIIIDEIQKTPSLLDIVHKLIEEEKIKFILTGSSARKLKHGGANLLAGRAFVYNLYPFSSVELGSKFDLNNSLNWGMLPKIWSYDSIEDKKEFLSAYALTYLKEEVQLEQLIRKIEPFRAFLGVAAQMNGKILNFSKIAKDIGVDTTTIQNYYSILEDTLLGFYLPSYHKSIRKRQIEASKFYFFDTGVVRALNKSLDVLISPKTYLYGDFFEHFLILEIRKLADYKRKSLDFSYLKTKDDVEIDLIIEESGKPTVCIEIKSTNQLKESDISSFLKITEDIKKSKAYCFSNDPIAKKIKHVECMHWQDGLKILDLV